MNRIICFGVHGNVIDVFYYMKGFQPQVFGFIAAVSHPQKAAQNRRGYLGRSQVLNIQFDISSNLFFKKIFSPLSTDWLTAVGDMPNFLDKAILVMPHSLTAQ